jgi:hypothetical protein
MSMIKRANGQVESFTDEQGKEVKADNLVWADEKENQPEIKDALDIPVVNDLTLDINSSDDDDSVIAKDC